MTAKPYGPTAPDGSQYITLTDGAGNLVTSLTPSGAAGGSLSGTYPNPTITANALLTTPVITGSVTNDAAGSGKVGEVLTAIQALDTISMTTLTAGNITSLSLPPGDYQVSGLIYYSNNNSTATCTYLEASISQTTNTRNLTVGSGWGSNTYPASTVLSQGHPTVPVMPRRISLATTTTIYLVGFAIFGVNTIVAGGDLYALRIR